MSKYKKTKPKAFSKSLKTGRLGADKVKDLEQVPGWGWSVKNGTKGPGVSKGIFRPRPETLATLARAGRLERAYRTGTLTATQRRQLERLEGWQWKRATPIK